MTPSPLLSPWGRETGKTVVAQGFSGVPVVRSSEIAEALDACDDEGFLAARSVNTGRGDLW